VKAVARHARQEDRRAEEHCEELDRRDHLPRAMRRGRLRGTPMLGRDATAAAALTERKAKPCQAMARLWLWLC
jgi:hypothetical protein